MTPVRILADDLTGALDSAARFVPLTGPLAVVWTTEDMPASAAIDAGTRELSVEAARSVTARLAPFLTAGNLLRPNSAVDQAHPARTPLPLVGQSLPPGFDPGVGAATAASGEGASNISLTRRGGEANTRRKDIIAFKKIDSLLRGHVAVELAACMSHFDHCVLAPAFPFQGRITRDGRQLTRDGDNWRDTGVDLAAALQAEGLTVPVRDAETDADLNAIVAQGRRLTGRVLWCGTGGLAGALAERRAVPCPTLPRPILALIGSDHPVSVAQLVAVPALHRLLPGDAQALASLLANGGAAVTVAIAPGTRRDAACHAIVAHFRSLLDSIKRPGTLMVAGGETLRRLCDALGATRLEVDGEVEPGAPMSLLRGGAWDGQRIVSKSGAFGAPDFLARLMAVC